MDSFEANKIFGAILGTVFVVFGGSLLAGGLYHSEVPEQAGYTIVAAEAPAAGEAAGPAAAVPIATLLASADATRGAAQFKKCQACHSGEEGGPNKVGPHLWDVVNRPIASISDFSYSAGMTEFSEGGAVKWDFEHLNHFIANPKGYVSGTAMGFAGLKSDGDRADLIAYLRTLSENPAPLPEAPAEGAAAAPAEGAAPAAEQAAAADPAAAAAPAAPAPAATEQAAATAPTAPAAPAPAAPAPATPAPPAAPAPAPPAAAPAPAAPAAPAGQAAAPAAAPAATTVAAAGDAKAGATAFRKCQACHAVGPNAANKVGPELNGIMGEAVAAVEGYKFSPALTAFAGTHPAWDAALLTEWLTNPKALVPGTKMAFPGIKKPEEIANIIAYLSSFDEAGAPK